MDWHEYLNAPIPRGRALIAVGLALSGTAAMFVQAKVYEAQAKEIIADLDERIKIYRDTTEFLMEHASGSTLNELHERLDYWRVIRGMPVEAEPEKDS